MAKAKTETRVESTEPEETKALATKPEAQAPVAATEPKPEAFDGGFSFNPEEITLPRILLQQKTSKKVDAGLTKPGDIINSLTDEKLGDLTKGVELILLSKRNAWTISTADGTFIKSEPAKASDTRSSREWTLEVEDRAGDKVDGKQEFTTIFRALLVEGLKNGDDIPVEISFKSKSYKAAKQLNSLVAFDQASGRPPYARTYKVGAATEKNKKDQSYFVWTAAKGVATTDEEKAAAVKWIGFMKKHDLKVDEASDVDGDSSVDSEGEASY